MTDRVPKPDGIDPRLDSPTAQWGNEPDASSNRVCDCTNPLPGRADTGVCFKCNRTIPDAIPNRGPEFHGCAIGLSDDECGYPGCLNDEGVCLMPYPGEADATRNSVRVGFKHEGTVRDEGEEPVGKIHVFADGDPATVNLWGSIADAKRLAEIIGADFYAY